MFTQMCDSLYVPHLEPLSKGIKSSENLSALGRKMGYDIEE